MATVTISNVSKRYDQELILDGINLSLEDGEFVVVVGPSGCGKSSLLRLVAGLDEVTSGEILINGRCVNDIHPSKRDIAMVFQSYALYPHMSVYDNLAYGLKMRKMPKAEIKSRVQAVAETLQLSAYLSRRPRELSGGQRQRVAMGRAIIRSPAVFLFDEPLSNLDPKLRTEMRHEIKKLHQQLNTTSLYVTHDQTEAMTLASRVLVLQGGRVEQIGPPKVLYEKPASLFVAGFTGTYPINFLEGKADTTSNLIHFDMGLVLPLPKVNTNLCDGEAVILGIRPEHFILKPAAKEANLSVKTMLVDDLGADKLLQVRAPGDKILYIRTTADERFDLNEFGLDLCLNKANLYHKNSGLRLGGWDDTKL